MDNCPAIAMNDGVLYVHPLEVVQYSHKCQVFRFQGISSSYVPSHSANEKTVRVMDEVADAAVLKKAGTVKIGFIKHG